MTHPALLSYAKTFDQTFSLILVVGREPNIDTLISDDHGSYDFDKARRCAFWNTSYSTVAATVKLTTAELKSRCRAYHGSPIIYADALPVGLKNSVTNKLEQRRLIEPERVRAHIATVFSYHDLVNRVKIVLLSGIKHEVFAEACEAIAVQCEAQHIPYYHLPFFYGTNTKRIREAMTVELSTHIQQVMQEFLQQQETS